VAIVPSGVAFAIETKTMSYDERGIGRVMPSLASSVIRGPRRWESLKRAASCSCVQG
jgi:hypothetical protein